MIREIVNEYCVTKLKALVIVSVPWADIVKLVSCNSTLILKVKFEHSYFRILSLIKSKTKLFICISNLFWKHNMSMQLVF